MSKISLGIYGEENLRLIWSAINCSSQLPVDGAKLDATNEVIYDTADWLVQKPAAEVKKQIIRRLKWFAAFCKRQEEIWISDSVKRQTRAQFVKTRCITDIIMGEMTEDELKKAHGEVYAEVTKESKRDQFASLAIEMLQKEISKAEKESALKIADFTRQMRIERDAKINALQKQIDALKGA